MGSANAGPARWRDWPVRRSGPAAVRIPAAAHPGNRPGADPLRVPEDEPRGLESGQEADPSALSGERLELAAEVASPATGSGTLARAPEARIPSGVWSLDFPADQLTDGRRFRALTVVDVFTRESLAIEVGQSLKVDNVVRVLNRIRQAQGVPRIFFCDSSADFTSQVMDLRAYQNGVQIDFVTAGQADR